MYQRLLHSHGVASPFCFKQATTHNRGFRVPLAHMDVATIRQHLQEGNNQCLEFIFQEHANYCLATIQKQTGASRDEAKGLFVDALLIFRDNILSGKIMELSNLRSYILNTCIHLQKQAIYKDGRRKQAVSHLMQDLQDGHPSVEWHIIDQEHKSAIKQQAFEAFNNLSAACRRILHSYYVQHMSMGEIAEELGYASGDVVKTKKSRCYKKWLSLVQPEANRS